MVRQPLGLRAYRVAAAAAAPVLPFFLKRRASVGKEQPSRRGERLGHSKQQRPPGPLVWMHGASVGECAAALPVAERLIDTGKAHVLLTSGTVASASMLKLRIPRGAVHQFVPVDTPAATGRFLSHWRPDVGVFVDSDLWPNLIFAAHARGTRLVLANARISKRSFSGWSWAPRSARALLSNFDLCLPQSEEFAQRFRSLGCSVVEVAGSLKGDAPPLFADPASYSSIRTAVGERPVFVAAQTHPGEDETVLPAHDQMRKAIPGLLTVIVPRHIERGSEIMMLCGSRAARQRSKGELPLPDTAVYVADTMNELGVFYRLGICAFVGGTLVPVGGHNPLEPARLFRPVLAGPNIANSKTSFDAIFAAQGAGLVSSSVEIAKIASWLIMNPAEAKRLGQAAAEAASTLGGAVARTVEAVETLLENAST